MRILAGLCAALAVLSILPAAAGEARWRITKTHWDAADEAGFGRFIQGFLAHDCTTPTDCFASSANPYRDTDPPGFTIDGDCADFIYHMRAYYAWKNGLPFTYAIYASPVSDAFEEDRRFTVAGNMIAARLDSHWQPRTDPTEVFEAIKNTVSTAMFRVAPDFDLAYTASDFYSPRIDRAAITPGALIYDIYGHVVFVAEVTAEGTVLTIDSNPDRSVTREQFGPHFPRDDPRTGVLFQKFRPIKLVNARRMPDGTLIGGRYELARNSEIADFSTEQAYGTEANPTRDWRKARFVVDGRDMTFYEFVRARLTTGADLAARQR